LVGMGLLLAMSAGLIFAYDVITQADCFRAERIDIVGARRLTRQEILDQVRLDPGVNIFWVNRPLVEKQLLAHPWIAGAGVERTVPNRLTLRITEYTPAAIVTLGARKFLMDRHGTLFKEVEPTEPLELPEVTGLDFADIRMPPHPQTIACRSVLEVLELGNRSDSPLASPSVQRIAVDPDLGLTLYLHDGTTPVRLGFSGYPEKYRRVRRVMDYFAPRKDSRRVRWIDASNADRIVVKLQREETIDEGKKEALGAEAR